MGEDHSRVRRRRAALSQLANLASNPKAVVIIHYSCQSFYDRPDGASPRVTSIAVRNLGSGQTTSFSIHQAAERDKKLQREQIEEQYDDLEKRMLKEFYDYADKHSHCTWLHWNMRDINYGFSALEHRCRVLGGRPGEIAETQRCDLARILVDLYGVGYMGHPRLAKLVEKNRITLLNFLTGEEEAAAFERGDYVKLHQSTLRKVDILANIFERTVDGTLKTNARLHEIYGGYWALAVDQIRNHWLIALIGAVSSIVGILALFF